MHTAQAISAVRSGGSELRRPSGKTTGKPSGEYLGRTTRPGPDRDHRTAPPSLAAALHRRRGRAGWLRRRPLSSREVEVLALIADGLSKEQAGRKLGISGPTVKSHLSRIYSALGAVNSAHAVAIAHCRGEIGPRGPEQRDPGLSWREMQVLAAVAAGLTVEEVGRTMYLSPHTVKSHLHHVYTKLGTCSRAAAVDRAFCCGLFVVQESNNPNQQSQQQQRQSQRSVLPVAA
jgi:DNA-binding CsgD family transcriptional regulator